MKLLFTTIVALVLATEVAGQTREQHLESYIQGTYLLIGKHLDSTDTYYGEAVITRSESSLSVTRTISGMVTHGTATVAHTTGDHTPVLRMNFSEDGKKYEETCIVAGDLDNYARITCYLYIPGTKTLNPGLEAFFIKPSSR